MADAAEKRWTVEEFLEWDDGTDRRYELVDGRIVAIAPPSEAHAAIVSNLAIEIREPAPAAQPSPGAVRRPAGGPR